MKYFTLLLLLLFMVASCSVDDIDNVDFTYQLMPATEIAIPDTLNFGQEYDFSFSYQRPSTCYGFAGFNVIEQEQEIKLGILNTFVENGSNCEELENITATETLNFLVQRNDYYIFKIYEGLDEEGNELYFTKQVMIEL